MSSDEEEHDCSNPTLCMMEECLSSEKTWDLVEELDEFFKDHTQGEVLTALAQSIVQENLNWYMLENGGIDRKEANKSLTEVLQSIRRLHETNLKNWENER